MGKTMSKTRNQNYDEPWSDLNHDVLYIIMMRLGVVDFVAFSGVCKSWRSFALSNRKIFMASKPPMLMHISPPPMSMSIFPLAYKKTCCIKDCEGRNFKTIIPHHVGRKCVGLTCGYLILFGKKTNDFWLVHPITRHQLYFPDVPIHVDVFSSYSGVRGVLVFSPLISRWVFVMANRFSRRVWFSIAGEGTWNYVSFGSPISDIHAFKGKIYTLNYSEYPRVGFNLCEMRLNPHSKLVILETKNFLKRSRLPMFISSGESLYVMDMYNGPEKLYKLHGLDFGEMKWVSCENAREEYALFYSLEHIAAFKAESRGDPWLKNMRYFGTEESKKGRVYFAKIWYFPHDCLKVNLIHER